MTEFWNKQPEAWKQCHIDCVSPEEAMSQIAMFYGTWSQIYKLIWVAMPVCFDWMFLKGYYSAFAPDGSPDIGFKATCGSTLRDYAIKSKIITNKEFDAIVKVIPTGLDHKAIDDATCQGIIFVELIKLINANVANSKKLQKKNK